MVECQFYTSSSKSIWDDFVRASKLALFFFERDYLEYHADRFLDASLIFYKDSKVIALFPATRNGQALISHGGLTYGGLIFEPGVRSADIQEVIGALCTYSRANGFSEILYKSVPYIFHRHPAQEDIYFLHNLHNARIVRRDLSCAIHLQSRLKLSKGRKWLLAKARKAGLQVTDSRDWSGFHSLLVDALSRHGVTPVHSAVELEYLHSKFPENIKLKTVSHEGVVVAACLLFVFNNVVHTQYLATSEVGKELGALDYIIEHCIEMSKTAGYDFFNFGISTEQQGRYLNQGLIAQKESFGARGVCVDFYEISLDD